VLGQYLKTPPIYQVNILLLKCTSCINVSSDTYIHWALRPLGSVRDLNLVLVLLLLLLLEVDGALKDLPCLLVPSTNALRAHTPNV